MSHTAQLIAMLEATQELVSDADRISVQLGIPTGRGLENVQLAAAEPRDVKDAVSASVWVNDPALTAKGEELAGHIKDALGFRSVSKRESRNGSTGFMISNSGVDKGALAQRLKALRGEK